MLDLLLDQNHDLDTSALDLSLVDGAARVKQQLLIKLKLWRGEWFLDTEFGTPYLPDVLGKQLTISGAVAAIRKSILEVDGVFKLVEFNYTFNRQTRLLAVDFVAQTPEGLIEVSL